MEKSLRSLIDWYDRVGVETPDLPLARSVRRVRPKAPDAQTRIEKPAPSARPAPAAFKATDPATIAAACNSIAELKTALDAYDAGALSDGARQTVLARGNPEADLMIIGEAPGHEEDREGLPFVGRSGQLLDRMLGAIGLKSGGDGPQDVYIGNVCFWRPPNNRKPDPAELDLCRPFVLRHIELVQPKLIILAGGTSLQVMTGIGGIMRNRGQWQSVTVGGGEIPALPLYHPAFLLRQPALKSEAWQDLLTVRERLASFE